MGISKFKINNHFNIGDLIIYKDYPFEVSIIQEINFNQDSKELYYICKALNGSGKQLLNHFCFEKDLLEDIVKGNVIIQRKK